MSPVMFMFQAEDGIRGLVRSRGLGDVYKRQSPACPGSSAAAAVEEDAQLREELLRVLERCQVGACLLYTSDAADERSSVDLGGRRIIKKRKRITLWLLSDTTTNDRQVHINGTDR